MRFQVKMYQTRYVLRLWNKNLRIYLYFKFQSNHPVLKFEFK